MDKKTYVTSMADALGLLKSKNIDALIISEYGCSSSMDEVGIFDVMLNVLRDKSDPLRQIILHSIIGVIVTDKDFREDFIALKEKLAAEDGFRITTAPTNGKHCS